MARVGELIEETGYTFKEIAEETGISLSALFIYARGERPISHKSRYKIARVIGCSVTDVVSRKLPQCEERKNIADHHVHLDSLVLQTSPMCASRCRLS